ncbi:MAG: hypothetical protein HY273_16925 [Gammaproteobacteria bacterium]|nr:hypothetical protein [Gammaproteobacteria bacterium]
MAPHLLASISFHGFGHIGQSAPVINALARRIPNLRVTLQCGAPLAVLRGHFHCAFTHLQETMDLGVVNQGALRVLRDDTARLYADFHADWDARLAGATSQLRALQPDVVFADVPYLSLAAAAQANITSVALCSLNWAEIYKFYCAARPEAQRILAHMHSGHAAAKVFLRPEPSLPMPDLSNTQTIGPLARVGHERRAELRQILGVSPATRLVVIALGGIKTAVTLDTWPRAAGLRWLAQADWNIQHPDALAWDKLGWNFIDVLRSADAFITKPGYCSFTEAACNGVPVLYVTYEDWPEQAGLTAWLPQHVPCAAISASQFTRGEFMDTLNQLMSTPRPVPPLAASGVEEAVDNIEPYLRT